MNNHKSHLVDVFQSLPLPDQAALLASHFNSIAGVYTASEPLRGGVPINAATVAQSVGIEVTKAPKAKRTRKAKAAKRGPVVPAAEAQAKVLAFLKANPADKFANGQIVKGTSLKVPTVQNAVKALVTAGDIHSAGERGQARYSATKAGLKASGKPAKKATKKVNVKRAHGANGAVATA